MSIEEITKLARQLIDDNNTNGWGYELGNPQLDANGLWRILVRWIPPGGGVFDGPGVIVVDITQKNARFWETP